ncbi:L-histidine N(alpha)-methyltransferase [Algoriphagus sediminis]|uniref:L-histidine N(Alpha)-methyltransferase n=1 Tax=Algoriphagus sediminis TaxID=3057113 RepID=A0ABT7YB27_9BACT|nr:L-histidine N(alpha)-methyltransferase [Algoriphagus sediminis]MDN3203716.1 L-histidine N(alpha)-methyltransferase [Algoriphagus sediminis]
MSAKKNLDLGSFAQDVLIGLSSKPKSIPSKYFYDATGDKLFQQIMAMPEYYLTRKEFEILENQHKSILKKILSKNEPFNLVELGAGDGLKTKILLRYLDVIGADFTYFPIDFSGTVLEELKGSLAEELPNLPVKPIEDTYRGSLLKREWENGKPSLILFLGGNIGNFPLKEARDVLDHLRLGTVFGDEVLLGFDLKKNPQTILDAYHDKEGITREFNLNLLKRMNRELGANFDVEEFMHWPSYNPVNGECRSHLVSLKKQKVDITALNQAFEFEAFEPIFIEISKKYNLGEIKKLARRSGFELKEAFLDGESFFADVLWERV